MQFVEIGFWDLMTFFFGALVVFGSAVWAMSKLVLKGMDDRFRLQDQKFGMLGDDMRRIDSANHENEKRILRLRADLPNEYVRREDWIRFSSLIDTKLDRLNEKIDIALGVARNAE